ncbi:MAG: acyltransferase [Lachnospiraceae bacterium]|nr:acyltransferase [Butyrivibrio sp.]MCM1343389.1 acyltransferase [Muribaculaceae bacterium]MCM1410558.1 acyltransferase [Lachnospiraceae bacterium]
MNGNDGKNRERINWIDICKGIGIILVVLGHIVKGYGAANLFETYHKAMIKTDRIIYAFHMPLFFLISGYVFQMVYCTAEERLDKLKIQILDWGGVFALFSIFQWCAKRLAGAVVNSQYDLKHLLLFWLEPMSPYWYLWVLILFYGIFYILRNQKVHWCIVACLVGSCISRYIPSWDGLKQLLLYMFPFYIGMCFKKYDLYEKARNGIFHLITVLAAIFALAVVGIYEIELLEIPLVGIVISTLIGVAVICSIRDLKVECTAISILGRYSLEVYVMHCFITAPVRKLFSVIGITNFWLNVAVSLILGCICPLVIAVIMKKTNLHKFIFKPFNDFMD